MNHKSRENNASGQPEQERLAALFREHNDTLVRYLSVRLGNRHEAVDVAQEAYVRLLNLDRPDTVSYLRAFLYRTAENIAIDRLRRRRRTDELFDSEAEQEHQPRYDTDPARQLAGQQALTRMRAWVEELPPKCRQAFILYKFYDRGYAEIADTMDLTESMIRKYVLRALAHLKAKMQGEGME